MKKRRSSFSFLFFKTEINTGNDTYNLRFIDAKDISNITLMRMKISYFYFFVSLRVD